MSATLVLSLTSIVELILLPFAMRERMRAQASKPKRVAQVSKWNGRPR